MAHAGCKTSSAVFPVVVGQYREYWNSDTIIPILFYIFPSQPRPIILIFWHVMFHGLNVGIMEVLWSLSPTMKSEKIYGVSIQEGSL